MKRSVLATVFIILVAATPVLASAALSTDTPPKETALQIKEANNISEQGSEAMRNVQLARLALFQGNIDKAEVLIKSASSLLANDSIIQKKFILDQKKTNLVNDQYVVIDASIGIAEDYVASPEKKEAIKIANQKFGNGDKQGAIEQLRLAGINVMENLSLMPLYQTRIAVSQAEKLMVEHHYYEANLALKGAEDGIIVETTTIFTN
ncbi:hypothetical protein T637_24375 [Enterobacter hormaechei subsp. hoffmannii]|uniref:YfdX family protein n=1 Tax=Enterobacter hormaechei TaxID=158836 RepID=UPI0006282277|nr:YfdX family protein [Enterobacter hormaechei]KKJ19092.1 hypothetical protein T637_24375 [Enterobacter hormaechei subsp. hoffmannii]